MTLKMDSKPYPYVRNIYCLVNAQKQNNIRQHASTNVEIRPVYGAADMNFRTQTLTRLIKATFVTIYMKYEHTNNTSIDAQNKVPVIHIIYSYNNWML